MCYVMVIGRNDADELKGNTMAELIIDLKKMTNEWLDENRYQTSRAISELLKQLRDIDAEQKRRAKRKA